MVKIINKLLVGALAAVLLVTVTACGPTCANCGKTVQGEPIEVEGKYYCSQNGECIVEAAKAAIRAEDKELAEEIMDNEEYGEIVQDYADNYPGGESALEDSMSE